MLACGGVLGRECDLAVDTKLSYGLTRDSLFFAKDPAMHAYGTQVLWRQILPLWLRCRSADAGQIHVIGRASSFGICFSVSSRPHASEVAPVHARQLSESRIDQSIAEYIYHCGPGELLHVT